MASAGSHAEESEFLLSLKGCFSGKRPVDTAIVSFAINVSRPSWNASMFVDNVSRAFPSFARNFRRKMRPIIDYKT